jgi:hypothetical protein
MNMCSLILGILLVLWIIIFCVALYESIQCHGGCARLFFMDSVFGENVPK